MGILDVVLFTIVATIVAFFTVISFFLFLEV